MEKVSKCFKSAIKECDCFGTFITFRMGNDLGYKSLIGGCSSIIYLIITVIYVFYMSVDFLTRKNVEFIFSNKVVESGPFVNLTDTKFNFAFGVQYSEDASPAIA